MKDLTLQIDIKIYKYNELSDTDRELMNAACEATQRSYAPYSHFSVGAAARLADGRIVTGTNQENAAYDSWKRLRTVLLLSPRSLPGGTSVYVFMETSRMLISPLRMLPAHILLLQSLYRHKIELAGSE